MTPLVSIVIPWNGDPRIEGLLGESEANWQSLPFQVLVVDVRPSSLSGAPYPAVLCHDGVEIVAGPPGAGPGVARNIGLEGARGRYVVFFDADDTFTPSHLLAAIGDMEAQSLDVAVTQFYVRSGGVRSLSKDGPLGGDALQEALWHQPGVWRFIFARQWLARTSVEFPDLKYAEDLLFLASFIEFPGRRAWVEPAYYSHSMDPDQTRLSSRIVSPGEVQDALNRLAALKAKAGNESARRLLTAWQVRLWTRSLVRRRVSQIPMYLARTHLSGRTVLAVPAVAYSRLRVHRLGSSRD